jgi:uncharacterized protein with von Willebrand factor type A (vWA) domain
MNTTKHTEIVRLIENEPLTLACSALADFLWQDFIRDARPTVTYLIDTYNIKQLSRFGKELFERLYSGDSVAWLVTEQAYEDYFRKVADGDTAALPEGYKPENGIWHSVMSDLSHAAAWPELIHRSVGDQFNAGNNAINILNELSKVIEEAIEEGLFDVQLLTASAETLEDIREEYRKAVQEGDTDKANKLRQQGKALGAAIEEAIQQAKDKVQSQSHRIVDKAIENSDETNDAIGNLHGNNEGVGSHGVDLATKKELAKKLEQNKNLKKLIQKLGALRRLWNERKRARKTKDNYEAITGVKFGDDVTKTFPVELALAASQEGKALFAMKYAQKTLLTKDYTSTRKDLGKGPIVMYVDVSGSMSGEAEIWSKAIAFVIAENALKENREIQIHLFDTKINGSVVLSKERKNNSELLDFVGTWTLGGGTSFNAVLAHAVDKAEISDRADVLMITDGHSEVHANFIKRIKAFKESTGVQWSTVCINTDVPEVCEEFSDEVYSVNLYNHDATMDAIQQCIR